MTYSQAAAFPFWIWGLLAAIFVGLPVLVIGIAVLLRSRASRSAIRQADGPAEAARSAEARTHARRITRCGLAGLGVGALLGLALILSGRGALAVLACAGGYLTGLLMGEYAAQPPVQGQLRAATLRARRAADYAPRWAAAAVAVAATLTIAAVIAFAAAPTISYGPWHPVPGASFTLPGGRTTWPGWPGTAAGALVAVAIALLGTAGLRRVAARPQLTDGSEPKLDELLRRQSGRAIVGAVLGLELIVLAGILIAGSEGLAVPIPAVSAAAYTGNRVMVMAGLCCGAGGVLSWLVLSGWTRRKLRGGEPGGREPGRGREPGGGRPGDPGLGSPGLGGGAVRPGPDGRILRPEG